MNSDYLGMLIRNRILMVTYNPLNSLDEGSTKYESDMIHAFKFAFASAKGIEVLK